MVLSLLLVLVVEPQKKIETLRFSFFPLRREFFGIPSLTPSITLSFSVVGLFRRGEQHLWKTTLFTSLLGISTSTISGLSGDHPSEVVFLLFSMRTRAAEGDSCTTARQFCCLAPGGEEGRGEFTRRHRPPRWKKVGRGERREKRERVQGWAPASVCIRSQG